MVELYHQADYLSLKKRYRFHWVLTVSLAFACFVFGSLSFLFFTSKTSHWMFFIPFFFYLLGGWVVIYGLFQNLLPLRHRLKTYYRIASSKPKIEEGILSQVSEPFSESDERKAVKLVFTNGKETHSLYYDLTFGPLPFAIGSVIRYEKSGMFLTAYEVLKHECEN